MPVRLGREEMTLPNLNECLYKLKNPYISTILMTQETLQGLELEHISLVHSQDQTVHQKVAILSEILQELNQAYALIDEVDIILDPMQEVCFPVGEVCSVEPDYVQLVRLIFESMLTTEIKESVRLEENLQVLLTPEKYHVEVKPKIAHQIISLFRPFTAIPDAHKQYLENYLCGKKNQDFDAFMTEWDTSGDQTKKQILNFITLAKGILHIILPYTLNKMTNRQYGRDEQDPTKIVPYLGAQSPTNTTFASPWETLVYHFQTALFSGISRSHLTNLIQQLYTAAFLTNRETPIDRSSKGIEFFNRTGIYLSQINQPDQLQKAIEAINSHSLNRLWAESETLHRSVSYHPLYVRSTSHNFTSQMARRLSFSGTPWNISCYPLTMQSTFFEDPDGVEPRVIAKIAQRESKIYTLKEATTENFFLAIQEHPERARIRALIDAGGLFQQDTTETLARKILDSEKSIESVFFFGSAPGSSVPSLPTLLKRGGKPVRLPNTKDEEFKKQNVDPNTLFCIYDESHCEGTDINFLPPNTIGVVTIDPKIQVRTLCQATLRLRRFLNDHQQTTCFLLLNATQEEKKINRAQDIIALSIDNQALLQTEQTYRAYQQLLENIPRSKLKEKLHQLPVKEQSAFLALYQKYFVKTNEQEPFTLFGQEPDSMMKGEALLAQGTSLIKDFQSQCTDTEMIKAVEQEINEVLTQIQNNPYLQTLTTHNKTHLGMQQQLQQENARELDTDESLKQELEELYKQSAHSRKEPYKEIEWKESDVPQLRQLPIQPQRMPQIVTASKLLQQTPYKHDYYKIFTQAENLYISLNFATTCTQEKSFLSRYMKAAYQIVIIYEEGSLKALLVSLQEAAFFKTHMEKHKTGWLWLIDPHEHEISSHQHAELDQNSQENLKKLLCLVNLLNGNVSYLTQHAQTTLDTMSQNEFLFLRFLQLMIQRNETQLMAFQHSSFKNILHYSSLAAHTEARHIAAGKARAQALSHEEIQKLSLADGDTIVNLSQAQIAHLPPNLTHILSQKQLKEISSLSPEQINFLQPIQLEWLTHPDVLNTLPPEKIKCLKSNQIKLLSSRQGIQSLKDSQLQHLLPSQFSDLSESQLLQLVDNTTIDLCDSITPPQLRYILDQRPQKASSLIKAIKKKELYAILKTQEIDYLTPEQVSTDILEPPQIREITSPQLIAALPLNKVNSLSPAQVKKGHLNGKQIQALTERDLIQAVPIDQVNLLSPLQVARDLLTEDQIQHLSKSDLLQAVPLDQVNRLSREQVASCHLTEDQIQHLNKQELFQGVPFTQVNFLKPEQVATGYLNEWQIHQLNKQELLKVLPITQVNFFNPQQVATGHLSVKQIQALQKSPLIDAVPDKDVRHLLEAQIPLLTQENKIQLLNNPLLIAKLSNDLLGYLTEQQIATLTAIPLLERVIPHTRYNLTPAQVASWPNTSLRNLWVTKPLSFYHLNAEQASYVGSHMSEFPGLNRATFVTNLDTDGAKKAFQKAFLFTTITAIAKTALKIFTVTFSAIFLFNRTTYGHRLLSTTYRHAQELIKGGIRRFLYIT